MQQFRVPKESCWTCKYTTTRTLRNTSRSRSSGRGAGPRRRLAPHAMLLIAAVLLNPRGVKLAGFDELAGGAAARFRSSL
jgi:hypothetical protein